MAQKPTKKQSRDEAREAARLSRERRERSQRTLRWLIPSLASVAVVVVIAIVVVIIAVQPKPAPPISSGPKNMVSDGILFTAKDKTMQPVETAALKKGETPKVTKWPAADGIAHIVTYVDWSCPACKQFEADYESNLKALVASGDATLEIRPVAILDHNYSTNYSSRAANAAACVADYSPSSFYAVQTKMYAEQPAEHSAGLTNDEIIGVVHGAGLNDAKVDACIRGSSFAKWVIAATDRTTSTQSLINTTVSPPSFTTPTVLVNGHRWDGSTDFGTFIEQSVSS